MKTDIFTKPIGRRLYLGGTILLGVMAAGVARLIIGPDARGDMFAEKMVEMLPLMLVIGTAKIILSYKRIKDITLDPRAVYWLALPVLATLLNILTPAKWGIVLNQGSPLAQKYTFIVVFIAIIGILNLIFGLVLLFKRGWRARELTKNTSVTPSEHRENM